VMSHSKLSFSQRWKSDMKMFSSLLLWEI
jgi:hypothetical protein